MSTTHLSSRHCVTIWSSVALFYFYENILTTCLGVMTNDLIIHFNISHTQVGLLASAFFASYALMQIPVGWLIQRFSVRHCATASVLLCVLGSWLLAFSHCFPFAVLARVLMGIGASFAPLCAFEVSALYFHPRRFAMLTGLLLTFGSLGAIVGQTPFRALFDVYGFQNSILITGSLGLIIALMTYSTIPETKNDAEHSISYRKIMTTLKHVDLWWIMLYAAFMYGPYLVLQSVWGKPFIEESLQLSSHGSSTLLQVMMFGFLVGGPLLGYLSDYLNIRKRFLMISSIATGLLICALLNSAFMSYKAYMILLFLTGFSCSGFLISFTVLKQTVSAEMRSLSLGIMNSMNTLGGITLPPLIGHWIRQSIDIHAPNPYRNSLMVLPIVILLAFTCSLLIKKTRNHHETK